MWGLVKYAPTNIHVGLPSLLSPDAFQQSQRSKCIASKSYLANASRDGWQRVDSSFSSHYYSFARKVDENVDPAKFRRLCSAFPHLGFGVPCWCGVGGLRFGLGVGPAGLLCCALGKYLDPAGDRDRYGPQNPVYGGVLKISGTVLVAWRRKGSRVTGQLAVQFKMC